MPLAKDLLNFTVSQLNVWQTTAAPRSVNPLEGAAEAALQSGLGLGPSELNLVVPEDLCKPHDHRGLKAAADALHTQEVVRSSPGWIAPRSYPRAKSKGLA